MARWTGRVAMLAAALAAALALPMGAAGPAAAQRPEPQTTTRRSAEDQRQGDAAKAQVLAQFGLHEDPALTAYVDRIGRRLAAVSEQPGEPWTFTILNSPDVNAFALPGGQIYVTRGLLALANSEAELAGVLGHEIGHVTAGHAGSRQTRDVVATGLLIGARVLGSIVGIDPGLLDAGGQFGQLAAGGILADYSREDEMVADQLAVRYLARAGLDPFAQADFLDSLNNWGAVDAMASGRAHDPAGGFLASHPATPERAREAVALAREAGVVVAPGEARHRERYLDAIDGLVFGDSADQGFVRGQRFSHPTFGFTFTAPEGFAIANAADAVRATAPDGARLVMDGAPNPEGPLESYVRDTWVPAIARQFQAGAPGMVERRWINGLEAVTTTLPVQIQGRPHDTVLTALRLDGNLYRLAGLAPRGSGAMPALEDATETFRRLSPAEKAALQPRRIEVVTARPGDTVALLARRMAAEPFAQQRLRVLNALGADGEVRPGQRVKLVR